MTYLYIMLGVALIYGDIVIPMFEKFNGKGDPTIHVNAFIALCSEFVLP